jgi:rod shape-determining protein MreB and related proteins
MLTRLLRHYVPPLQAHPVVAACIPVLATAADRDTFTEVFKAALNPRSLLLIESVRAAAIGAGALTGASLILDVGAQLTELAVLSDAIIVTARRAEVGIEDLSRPARPDTIVAVAVTILDDMRRHAPEERWTMARRGGIRLVGHGALLPGLAPALAGALDMAVYPSSQPRTAALRGAGLTALATQRDPASATDAT